MLTLSFSLVLVLDVNSISVDPTVLRAIAVLALLLAGVATKAITKQQAIRALILTYVGQIDDDPHDQVNR